LRMNLNTLLHHEVFGNGKRHHAIVDYLETWRRILEFFPYPAADFEVAFSMLK
jgi:hypothetical protein